jgi:hypothetical protein
MMQFPRMKQTALGSRRRKRRCTLMVSKQNMKGSGSSSDSCTDGVGSRRPKRRCTLMVSKQNMKGSDSSSDSCTDGEGNGRIGAQTEDELDASIAARLYADLLSEGKLPQCCLCAKPGYVEGSEILIRDHLPSTEVEAVVDKLYDEAAVELYDKAAILVGTEEPFLLPFCLVLAQRHLWLHKDCAAHSPQAYCTEDKWHGLGVEVSRGRQLKCTACGKRGATIGCSVKRCKGNFHFPCAAAAGWEGGEVEFLCKKHKVIQSESESCGDESDSDWGQVFDVCAKHLWFLKL